MADIDLGIADNHLEERLKRLARAHGRTLEEEALAILDSATCGLIDASLWERSGDLFAGYQSSDLNFPGREHGCRGHVPTTEKGPD
ncbi:MAG: hypothetical protein AAF292_06500 [Pseudomonadota bacterium]